MTITELEFKITEKILGKDMNHVRAFLAKNYHVGRFGQMSPEQLKHFLANYEPETLPTASTRPDTRRVPGGPT
jgi:hypothetical protein